jgi:hypothetical protein
MEHEEPTPDDDELHETLDGYRVYIIEIMPKWYELIAPGLPDEKCCYYVGETGRDVGERFKEHKTGRARPGRREKRRAKVFAKMDRENGGETLLKSEDVILRRGMMKAYEPQPDKSQAEALEASVVDELREEGHCVYPRGVGTIPFDFYRDEAV